MKIIPFYQVIGWADLFFHDMRKLGMAGNIIRDSNDQLTEPELAAWSGQNHQLTFSGTPKDYCLTLYEFEGQDRKSVVVEKNSTKFYGVITNFFTHEG